jgi:enoyl-CoA hydratase
LAVAPRVRREVAVSRTSSRFQLMETPLNYETITIDVESRVATLTLNRPEKLNAVNTAMREELIEAVDRLSADDDVAAILLRGAGEKAFVAGADVAEFASRSPAEQRQFAHRRRVYDALAGCPKPTIAAIHGYCMGGGVELALCCDLRVADRTAQFSQAEIRVGLIPGAGGTQRLTRLVGSGQALRLALTGDLIDAEEAYRIGLVEFLVEPGKHVESAREIAGRITRWSPVAVRLVKQAVRAAWEAPLAVGLELEKELFLAAFASADGQEGIRAFVEGRKPVFKGR